jgi:hypothetical protein
MPASKQRDEPALRTSVPVNVSLRRLNGAMTGKYLHVTQAAAGAMNVASCGCDKGPAARVGRAAFKGQFGEHRDKPIDDAVGHACARHALRRSLDLLTTVVLEADL